MVSPMKPDAQAAIDWLVEYRLNTNQTYLQLSQEMEATGQPLAARSLHLALTGRVVPQERTQHRIKQFVAKKRAALSATRRVRRRKPAA